MDSENSNGSMYFIKFDHNLAKKKVLSQVQLEMWSIFKYCSHIEYILSTFCYVLEFWNIFIDLVSTRFHFTCQVYIVNIFHAEECSYPLFFSEIPGQVAIIIRKHVASEIGDMVTISYVFICSSWQNLMDQLKLKDKIIVWYCDWLN